MNRLSIVPFVTTILLCTTPMNTFTNTAKFYGSAHLSNQNYTDLDIRGSGHLTKVTVTNTATVKGSAYLIDFVCPYLEVKGSIHGESINVKEADIAGAFRCKHSQFDVLTVHGSFAAHATTIGTKLSVHGSIIASDLECPFITVTATRVELKNSRVKTMVVEKIASTYLGAFNLWGLLSWGTHEPKIGEVYLHETCVDSITFQGLPGRIILTHGAKVGTVVNGIVEYR